MFYDLKTGRLAQWAGSSHMNLKTGGRRTEAGGLDGHLWFEHGEEHTSLKELRKARQKRKLLT